MAHVQLKTARPPLRRPADVIASWAQRAALSRAEPSPPDDAEQRPAGPGWFDSSHALASGLTVHEDFSGEAAMRGWLEAWLRADRPKARGRAVPARRGGAAAEPAAAAALEDDASAAEFAAYDIDGWSLV
ncbi:MAG TPA: hypothetical protein VNU71_09940 [Burkholderiaceae bacterium]|nr:hypothetical protein [Burkholderiaceae bacterium]